MENKIKILLTAAILGLVVLYFVNSILTAQITKIADLKIGQVERISGMVTSVYTTKLGHTFLKVADNTGDIDVVVFNSSKIDFASELEVGQEISILGRVEEYKGKLELIAKEIYID